MDHGRNEFASNESLKARRDEACPIGLPSKSGIYAARAQGAELWDVEGKRYIDFIGGIGVLNVGHSHPKVVKAIREQAENFIHTAFGIAQYESYIEVLNKSDLLSPDQLKYFKNRQNKRPRNEFIASAITGEGCDILTNILDQLVTSAYEELQVNLNHQDGATLAWLYEHGYVVTRKDGETNIALTVRLCEADAERFRKRLY